MNNNDLFDQHWDDVITPDVSKVNIQLKDKTKTVTGENDYNIFNYDESKTNFEIFNESPESKKDTFSNLDTFYNRFENLEITNKILKFDVSDCNEILKNDSENEDSTFNNKINGLNVLNQCNKKNFFLIEKSVDNINNNILNFDNKKKIKFSESNFLYNSLDAKDIDEFKQIEDPLVFGHFKKSKSNVKFTIEDKEINTSIENKDYFSDLDNKKKIEFNFLDNDESNELKEYQDLITKNQVEKNFTVIVENHVKIDQIAFSHIEYIVKTINKYPQEKHGVLNSNISIVMRRYNDFRLLYFKLLFNHPGRIIPPIPSKQIFTNKFNEDFINIRKKQLENMLNKLISLPFLIDDDDFKIFLTCENFSNVLLSKNSYFDISDKNLSEIEDKLINMCLKPSFLFNNVIVRSLFSNTNTFFETDEYFIKQNKKIEELERNLKTCLNFFYVIENQMLNFFPIFDKLSIPLNNLLKLNYSKFISDLIFDLNELTIKLKKNFETISIKDQRDFFFIVEEDLRTIQSTKYVFKTRLQLLKDIFFLEEELEKKIKNMKNKNDLDSKVKTIQDLPNEIQCLKKKIIDKKKKFEMLNITIELELKRVDSERVENFKKGVENCIKKLIESQKEIIFIYELLYLRQEIKV